MKFKRTLKADVIIDLTSMIDVVFILLLFFMLATSFNRDTNLIINLPSANGQKVNDPAFQIDIEIERTGAYTVNGVAQANTDVLSLMNAIEQLSAGDQSVPVTISADANTTHQAVVTALDAVARLGISSINIATIQTEAN
ncbi:MAG: ExbD/TolR family protein [Pseudohongiellaceae bacterium]